MRLRQWGLSEEAENHNTTASGMHPGVSWRCRSAAFQCQPYGSGTTNGASKASPARRCMGAITTPARRSPGATVTPRCICISFVLGSLYRMSSASQTVFPERFSTAGKFIQTFSSCQEGTACMVWTFSSQANACYSSILGFPLCKLPSNRFLK